jgi:hypothetical protein
MSNNFYCNFTATGAAIDVERLKKGLDKLWCRAEIKDGSSSAVSAATIDCGLLADGWDAVEGMVEQFAALSFSGTLYTTRHREYLWSFEGRDGATTWQTSYDEEIAETEAQIRAYYAADEQMMEAIHKNADSYEGMSEVEIAEIVGRINAYYAAFREQELAAARDEEARASSETAEAPMTRAERAQARAELLREVQDTLKDSRQLRPLLELKIATVLEAAVASGHPVGRMPIISKKPKALITRILSID